MRLSMSAWSKEHHIFPKVAIFLTPVFWCLIWPAAAISEADRYPMHFNSTFNLTSGITALSIILTAQFLIPRLRPNPHYLRSIAIPTLALVIGRSSIFTTALAGSFIGYPIASVITGLSPIGTAIAAYHITRKSNQKVSLGKPAIIIFAVTAVGAAITILSRQEDTGTSFLIIASPVTAISGLMLALTSAAISTLSATPLPAAFRQPTAAQSAVVVITSISIASCLSGIAFLAATTLSSDHPPATFYCYTIAAGASNGLGISCWAINITGTRNASTQAVLLMESPLAIAFMSIGGLLEHLNIPLFLIGATAVTTASLVSAWPKRAFKAPST